jgi:hypothetical protein
MPNAAKNLLLKRVEVEAMTQESALTREEIEALDDEQGTLGFEPPKDQQDADAHLDQREVRTQQPEDRS